MIAPRPLLRNRPHLLAAGLLLGLPATVGAAGYNGTNPGPRSALRSMSTDRPDATESPFTIDAGHAQFEMSVANFTRDREGDARSEALNFGALNLRFGLTSAFEVQIVLDNYRQTKAATVSTGARARRRGFGDVTLRAKANLRGNSGGAWAFGVMPFLKLPTSSAGLGNGSFEGGLILPVAFKRGDWGMGAMTELDVVRNDADSSHAARWVNTFTVGRDVTERLGAFTELASTAGEGGHALTFNCGITYMLTPDIQLDCGAYLGVSRSAPDAEFFAGFSRRF